MCGITGYFSPSKKFSSDILPLMTDAIMHRGPDSYGYFNDHIAGLGHRRLSIIDLSENGNQPMLSANQRFVIAYNGEVYNFREIAAELKQNCDIVFKSSSDTEIILEAFSFYGPEFVLKLNGMFSIAIYDKIQNELYIFRDRIGIKPLYYYWDGESLVFASELKALKKIKTIDFTINKNSIYYYLHLGFVPTPLSIYQSIKKLEAGHWLKVNSHGLIKNKYWSVNSIIKDKIIEREKEAIVKLSDLLMSSVQYQIKSDVPFGVFLSGGIDSSLITANAVNLSGVKVNTFSIGFEENKYNESVYAKTVANYLKTNHHEFIVSYNNAIELVEDIPKVYDEPFADPSCIPTMLVSKLAKQHVTVTLSGEGGDELFHGYGAYNWAKRLNKPFIKLFRQQIANVLQKTKYYRHADYFRYPDENLQFSHILAQEQYYFTLANLENLLSNEIKSHKEISNIDELNQFGTEINNLNKRLTANEKQSIFDLNYYLQDDLLTKVDRASMKYSLETRVPYLDHRIIEFALNLSPNLKMKNGDTKYILKEILYQYLPKKFFDRPKQGFAIPLEKWLKNELHYLIQKYLNKEIIEKYNYLNYEYVQQLVNDFLKNKTYYYSRIWQLIILNMWLENNEN